MKITLTHKDAIEFVQQADKAGLPYSFLAYNTNAGNNRIDLMLEHEPIPHVPRLQIRLYPNGAWSAEFDHVPTAVDAPDYE